MHLKKRMLIGAAIVVATLGLSIASGHGPLRVFDDTDIQTIVITARDMKFNSDNPTIFVAPGTTVRVILVNEDPGMKHDLVIPEMGIRTPILRPGEEAVLEFRVPDSGTFAYFCSMHRLSMQGFFSVGNPADPEVTRRSN